MLYEDNYLAHFGIKGMRWGVRRFQNKNGTLNAKGLMRLHKLKNRLKKSNLNYKKYQAEYEKIAYRPHYTDFGAEYEKSVRQLTWIYKCRSEKIQRKIKKLTRKHSSVKISSI